MVNLVPPQTIITKVQHVLLDWLRWLCLISPSGRALKVVGAIIFQPINRVLPLRCLEEKYGLSNNHRDRLMAQERRSQKRLSLNIVNGHSHDSAHTVLEATHCLDNGAGRGSQLRWAHNPSHRSTNIPQWLEEWGVHLWDRINRITRYMYSKVSHSGMTSVSSPHTLKDLHWLFTSTLPLKL